MRSRTRMKYKKKKDDRYCYHPFSFCDLERGNVKLFVGGFGEGFTVRIIRF